MLYRLGARDSERKSSPEDYVSDGLDSSRGLCSQACIERLQQTLILLANMVMGRVGSALIGPYVCRMWSRAKVATDSEKAERIVSTSVV